MLWNLYSKDCFYILEKIMLDFLKPQKQIFETIKTAIKLRKVENKHKELSLELLKEFKDLNILKKWFDFKTYTVRENGIIDKVNIKKIFITLDVDQEDVLIQGELNDGTYLKDAYVMSLSDVEKIAADFAASNINDLYYHKEKLLEEVSRVKDSIKAGEKRLAEHKFEEDKKAKMKELENLEKKTEKKAEEKKKPGKKKKL